MFKAEKRSIRLRNRSTTIRLELPFWHALEEIADSQKIRLSALVMSIEHDSQTLNQQNLTSCLRVFCLKHFEDHATRPT